MSQVVRTVNDLIVHSLYMIGELGVGESPDNFMLDTGLELANELLDEFSNDSIFIPYLKTIDFTMEPGKAIYSVSNIDPADIEENRIIDLTFANYTVQTIVYPIAIIDKAEYHGVVRLNNLSQRPGFVFLDKQPTISYLTFYPAPDQPYPCSIKSKVMLNKLENQDTLIELAPYYYAFLKLAMGRKWISYYPSGNWPQTNEDDYQRVYKELVSANETDITIRPSVILDAPQPFYWPNILAY